MYIGQLQLGACDREIDPHSYSMTLYVIFDRAPRIDVFLLMEYSAKARAAGSILTSIYGHVHIF